MTSGMLGDELDNVVEDCDDGWSGRCCGDDDVVVDSVLERSGAGATNLQAAIDDLANQVPW